MNMDISNDVLTVRMKMANNLLGDITPAYIDKALPVITERIQTGQKPAATFEKELSRIELHRQQLRDAYLSLLQSYAYIITPQTRQSPKDKIILDMLEAMPDKMLRQYAEMYLANGQAQEYVLPSERDRLIEATMVAIKEKQG
jgi:hypothetical protein